MRDINKSLIVIPLCLNQYTIVTEYKPFIHRPTPPIGGLGLDSTYPKTTNVASETLRIRHGRFSLPNATHTGILTSLRSSQPSGLTFTAAENAPLPLVLADKSQSSVVCLSLVHFRRYEFHPVRCYAFFKRWLLLSQLPGCLKFITSLTTEHTLETLDVSPGCCPFDARA